MRWGMIVESALHNICDTLPNSLENTSLTLTGVAILRANDFALLDASDSKRLRELTEPFTETVSKGLVLTSSGVGMADESPDEMLNDPSVDAIEKLFCYRVERNFFWDEVNYALNLDDRNSLSVSGEHQYMP